MVIRRGSIPRTSTPERLVWLVTITSDSMKGATAATPSIAATLGSTWRYSVNIVVFLRTTICARVPRIFERRSCSKPPITLSTTTSAEIPRYTPKIEMQVKTEKTKSSVPKTST
ncbi:MAG: hypothetical protein CSA24_00855 [Deltaproteobacteria bacterium]|nr:MAG: hypothetical protein CSA24_00855 [Deltaproteobacteria bacterium]